MTPRPLYEVGLGPASHRPAMWWLGLLYRRPERLRTEILGPGPTNGFKLAALLYVHFLPYGVGIAILGRLVVFGMLDVAPVRQFGPLDHLVAVVEGHGLGIVAGMALGLAFGLGFLVVRFIGGGSIRMLVVEFSVPIAVAFAVVIGTAGCISFGVALGITLGISTGPVGAITAGVIVGAALGLFLGIAFAITRGTFGRIVFWLVVGLTITVVALASRAFAAQNVFWLAAVFVAIITFLRLYYLPSHAVLAWPRPRGRLYRFHPVAWDDVCVIPYVGLSQLLVDYAHLTGEAGREEVDRLIDAYPSQRTEALKAKTVLIAREAARTQRLTRLPDVCAGLPEGNRGFLADAPRLRDKVAEIAALQTRLETVDRPFLREPIAMSLVKTIEAFRARVSGFREPTASEFRAAAREWLKTAQRQLRQASEVLERKPTPQVFRAGDPVDRDREAFVPRLSVFGALEQQVMLATGCPGILLYGRRRTGKSTVLRNLTGFLPSTVVAATVSLQSPQAFSSAEHLMASLHQEICRQMPELSPDVPEDLATFYHFLTEVHTALGNDERRLLLGLDEFEMLDVKIQEGVFSEDVLATFRESIQSHRNLTWVFAGSHSLEELSGAEWASYLVAARMVEVPPFTMEETRTLLTEPLQHSRFFSSDGAERPRFAAEMWGDEGIERLHREAGGWPHLVQLLAETLVDAMNNEGKERVDGALFARALEHAVVAGDAVLSQLLRGESRIPGEWEYLLGFREREVQPVPDDGDVRRSLRRRCLVVEEGTGWRLGVPLFRRWLWQRW